MKSLERGTNTSEVEVLNISLRGVWLYISGKEYFLSYTDFPWFKDATVSSIHHVKLLHSCYLRWNDLDIDLELASLEHLDRYPLAYH